MTNFKLFFLLWLGFIGFAATLPIVWIRHITGVGWHGVIPNYVTDTTFYLARVSKTITDFPISGNHYYLEHRFDLQPVFSVAEAIVALPMKLGVSFNWGLLLGFIAASIIFALFAYKFLRNFVDQSWAVVFASLAYAVSYGGLVRPVIMETVLPVFIIFNWAMIGWLLRPEKKRYHIFLVASFAGSFYLYSYLWQVIAVSTAFLWCYLLATRQWTKFFGLSKISLVSLLLAAPAVFYTIQLILLPGYWENMYRVGLVITRLPPMEAYYYGRWLILGGLVWAILFRKKFTDKVAYVFIVNAAILLALLSNIITGKDFLIATHINRFSVLWFVLTVCIGAYYFIKNKYWNKKVYATVPVLAILLVAFWPIFSEAKRSIFPSFSLSKQEMLSVQDYRAPIAWLDTNELEPKAIWADDNISRYIPYLSKHYVLYPGLLNAHFYIMPTSEIHERYLISRYFQNPNLEILRREYVYYAGSYFDYKMNDLNLRHRICAIVKLSNNFCQEQFVQSLVSQKDRDIMAVYQLEKTSIRPHINEYLRKYGVSYFIRDIAQNPVQTRFVSMVPVYTDGRFEIYKIDIR